MGAQSGNPTTPPVIAVIGPTASGKSGLALRIAEAVGGEIVNMDSMQVYCGMDIGTAKPGPEDLARVPHHLLDRVTPDADYSAGRFAGDVAALLPELAARGKVPVFCGGTGLYYRALTQGLADIPQPDEATRVQMADALASRGAAALHGELAQVDPAAAARIHPNDPQRIVRALEVFHATGRPLSAFQADAPRPVLTGPLLALGIGWPRAELYARINARTPAMLAAGWVEEVRSLLARGYGPELKPMRGIGYAEIAAHLAGELPESELAQTIATRTRHYAKRQLTWFRREPGIHWQEPGTLDALPQMAREFVGE